MQAKLASHFCLSFAATSRGGGEAMNGRNVITNGNIRAPFGANIKTIWTVADSLPKLFIMDWFSMALIVVNAYVSATVHKKCIIAQNLNALINNSSHVLIVRFVLSEHW